MLVKQVKRLSVRQSMSRRSSIQPVKSASKSKNGRKTTVVEFNLSHKTSTPYVGKANVATETDDTMDDDDVADDEAPEVVEDEKMEVVLEDKDESVDDQDTSIKDKDEPIEHQQIAETDHLPDRATRASLQDRPDQAEALVVTVGEAKPEVDEEPRRTTRASKAFARKEEVAADLPINRVPEKRDEPPAKPTRKRSSKTLDVAKKSTVEVSAAPSEAIEAKIDGATQQSTRSVRTATRGSSKKQEPSPSKEADNETEDDSQPEPVAVVVTPGPPKKMSKMTQPTESSSSKPRSRFAASKFAEQAEEKTAASSQYTFPNKATFSGTVSSGSSSSSHFKHKYVSQ